jgi:tRNA pseudouridine32 synthase/23S rRNA pseudouridine746 synthase
VRPPLQDGVGASVVQLEAGPWPTVLAFLQARFPAIDAAQWQSRIERGLVRSADGAPVSAVTRARPGERIWYYRELPPEPEIPFAAQVLHRDAHLLVVDKPHFLPVMPAGRFLQQTLLVRLKKALGLDALVPLHRIDRATAGLVLFSLNPASRARYQALFPQRAVHKTYEALAPTIALGLPLTRRSRIVAGEPFFRMREVAGTANAETLIELQQARGALSLYRLSPRTGRKHQLRVHMAALGAPILNDPCYPELQPATEADDYTRPLQLLARALAFDDPLSGAPRRFESRLQLQAAVPSGAAT